MSGSSASIQTNCQNIVYSISCKCSSVASQHILPFLHRESLLIDVWLWLSAVIFHMTSRVRLRSYLGNSAMSWWERDDPAASVSYIQLQLPLCDELKHLLLSSNARNYYSLPSFFFFFEKKKMPSFLSFVNTICLCLWQRLLPKSLPTLLMNNH